MKALINVDIVEALRNIVNLKVDNYQSDIVYDILDLSNSKVNDYFCFMTRNSGTWLFEQNQVYIKNSQANVTWKTYQDRDVSTYAIEITYKEDNKIIGNIYEIDYKKTLEDVLINEKQIDKVEVTFKDDSKVIFDFEHFKNNRNTIINNYGEIKGTKNLIKDYFSFNLHLNKIKSERQKKQRPIRLDDYLKDINKKKLNELGYKKNDMYYISSTNCKKILDQTSINVYMLQGNRKIRLDRPVSNYEKPTYAIWSEDKKRFDDFDRKELNRLIRDYINERRKKDKLIDFGYKNNDIYLLDSNKEIKSAFNKNITMYSIDKNLNKSILKTMKEISNNVNEGNIIAVNDYDKDRVKESLYQNNQSNYIDILNVKEVATVINIQIKEATYFNRIKEGESEYLIKNIDNIAEKFIKDYDVDTNIHDKIDYLMKDVLKNKNKGIEGRNEKIPLKDKIEKAKEKSLLTNKDNGIRDNQIER
ncbi:MAG: hypothetical protein GX309_04020 [Clostridiales bacterium]|nr:hypothetical protein [Clostridiales bacterium]